MVAVTNLDRKSCGLLVAGNCSRSRPSRLAVRVTKQSQIFGAPILERQSDELAATREWTLARLSLSR